MALNKYTLCVHVSLILLFCIQLNNVHQFFPMNSLFEHIQFFFLVNHKQKKYDKRTVWNSEQVFTPCLTPINFGTIIILEYSLISNAVAVRLYVISFYFILLFIYVYKRAWEQSKTYTITKCMDNKQIRLITKLSWRFDSSEFFYLLFCNFIGMCLFKFICKIGQDFH